MLYLRYVTLRAWLRLTLFFCKCGLLRMNQRHPRRAGTHHTAAVKINRNREKVISFFATSSLLKKKPQFLTLLSLRSLCVILTPSLYTTVCQTVSLLSIPVARSRPLCATKCHSTQPHPPTHHPLGFTLSLTATILRMPHIYLSPLHLNRILCTSQIFRAEFYSVARTLPQYTRATRHCYTHTPSSFITLWCRRRTAARPACRPAGCARSECARRAPRRRRRP